MGHLDLKDFTALLLEEHYTVEKLRRSSAQDLKNVGLPSTAIKKIMLALQG